MIYIQGIFSINYNLIGQPICQNRFWHCFGIVLKLKRIRLNLYVFSEALKSAIKSDFQIQLACTHSALVSNGGLLRVESQLSSQRIQGEYISANPYKTQISLTLSVLSSYNAIKTDESQQTFPRKKRTACVTLVYCLDCSSGLTTKACSSKVSIDRQRTTRRYIPDDKTLPNHRSQNLKFP